MSRRLLVNVMLAAGGAVLLAWQVREAGGLPTIVEGLSKVGAGFLFILALTLARFAARTLAWVSLLIDRVPFGAALAATLSGDALGNVTPLGLAASEPAKAFYLKRVAWPMRALAALTAENFFYTATTALYVLAGAAAMLVLVEHLPDAVRAVGIVTMALMAGVLIVSGWIAWARPTAFGAIIARLPWARLRAFGEQARTFETQMYESVQHPDARVGMVLVAELGFHLGSFLDTWVVLWLITGQSLVLAALVLDSVNRVVNIAFKLIPFKMGVDEVSAESVAMAVGLAPGVGLLTALVRKLRMFVFAAVGLALWATRPRTARPG
jgi:hypothetical protein